MQRYHSIAGKRAAWLGEIAAALDEARRVIEEISTGDHRAEVFQLYTAIEALRLEVESIQMRRPDARRAPISPFRTQSWRQGVTKVG